MHGPEDLGARVAGWLNARIPARLRIIEQRLALDSLTIADPAQVLDHERGPIGIEDWPSVFTLPGRMLGTRLVDVEDGGAEQYLTTYRVQVLAWVRADTYEATSRLRHRYALAIREALLERKSLTLSTSTVLGDPDTDLAVDPRSIREDYSPLIVDEGRTIAGVTVDVDVTVRELLEPPPPYGTVTTTTVNVAPLPAHPSLT